MAQLPLEVKMRDGAERNVTVSDRHGLASRVDDVDRCRLLCSLL